MGLSRARVLISFREWLHSYVQAQQIFETLDFPLLERFEKRDVRPELSLHDEQLTVIDGLITKLALYRREELI